MLVKIDRSTIKKNPKAGNTRTFISGPTEISFTYNGNNFPELLLNEENCYLRTWSIKGDYYEGILTSREILEQVWNLEGFTWNEEMKYHWMDHAPEPSYHYKYENPLIECDNCHNMIHVQDIEDEYSDEGNHYTICPICKEVDSFEDLQFESISAALKE